MLGIFEQYWHRATAGITRSFSRDPGLRSQLAQLERQILALVSDIHTLDGKQERIRAEVARNGSELLRRIDGLDQARRENDISRTKEDTRRSECEQRIAGLETGCSQDWETLAVLKASVSETTRRLETRNQQIKFLQDSARDQLQAFRTQLADTSSRLETRDNETNRRLDEEHQLLVSLESSLAETLGQVDAAELEITSLHQDVAGQRLQIESFLDGATAQLEVANNRATILEKHMQADAELKEKQLLQLKLQLKHQQTQLLRAILAVAIVLVLLVSLTILR